MDPFGSAPAAATALGKCATHVDVVAVDNCTRCGNYICQECVVTHEWESYCPECAERIGATGKESARALWALVLGLTSLVAFCLPLGIGALILGQIELNAIKAGEAPAAGRNLATGAVILGWISVALLLGMGLLAVAIAAAG
ncbi:MAG: DUF4190 domain-containing protein [Myxococcota bacterium]